MTQVQEALLDLYRLDAFIDQVHRLGAEVETIIRNFPKLEHLPAPPDTLDHRALIDHAAWRSHNELLLDPGRIWYPTDTLELRNLLLRHPEERQERPDLSFIEGWEDEYNRSQVRCPGSVYARPARFVQQPPFADQQVGVVVGPFP